MRKSDYVVNISLLHNELPARVDIDTGEVTIATIPVNNLPDDSEIFEKDALFQKSYTNSWRYLESILTNLEYCVANRLALMAKANTNSLEPLNDETTVETLVTVLKISKNNVSKVLKTLFNLGVYGKFEVSRTGAIYTKYWVFNPYLVFSGKVIKSDIIHLFKGTDIEKAFNNPDYGYIPKRKSNPPKRVG